MNTTETETITNKIVTTKSDKKKVFIELKSSDKKISHELILNRIKKFCKLKKIDKIIRIDNDTSYWTNDEKYIQEIFEKIQERNIKKIIEYSENKCIEIKQNYFNNKKILIMTNNNIDTSIILFTYMFKYIANMNWKQSITSLQSKVPIPLIIKNNLTKQIIKTII